MWDSFRQDPINDIPTLLLTGTLDSRTYLNEQTAATKGLFSLTQLKIINGEHNVFMVSPKVTNVIKAFWNNGETTMKSITINLPQLAPKN